MSDPPRRYRGFRSAGDADIVDFTWNERNREVHFEKHGLDFPIVRQLDWTRIKRRRDTRHSERPPRWIALVRLPPTELVFVVVYSKKNKLVHIVSVRLANATERQIFLDSAN
jgi:uncharacterized DUF497 family protein